MFKLNLLILVLVCFFCYSHQQLNANYPGYSNSCRNAIRDYNNNVTYFSPAYTNFFDKYLYYCAGGLNENTTKVTCQNDSNPYYSKYEAACKTQLQVRSGNTTTLDSGKWCSLTLTGVPLSDTNYTYSIVTNLCVPAACTEGNDTDVIEADLKSTYIGNGNYHLNWNQSSTFTVKCGGFPTWAIILIVIIIIIVAVVIIIAVVVTLRKRTQYQNI